MGGHRASFPTMCAAPCGDAPSLTRQAGPGNAFLPAPTDPSPDGPTLVTKPADGPHLLATGRFTCHGTDRKQVATP